MIQLLFTGGAKSYFNESKADKQETESSFIEKIFGKYTYNLRKIDFKSSYGNSLSTLDFPWANHHRIKQNLYLCCQSNRV